VSRPNFKRTKEKAYETLMLQENFSFPINPKTIQLNNCNIQIISMQEYSKKTNQSIDKLTLNGSVNDGYTYRRGNNFFIFYNEDVETEERKTWTISHELGHIALGHATQCDDNEIEANFFASQLLAPQCVLKEILKNGVKLTQQYLTSKFKISNEASSKCLITLSKVLDYDHITTQYDDIIIELFKPYVCDDYSNDSFLEELENNRNNFY